MKRSFMNINGTTLVAIVDSLLTSVKEADYAPPAALPIRKDFILGAISSACSR